MKRESRSGAITIFLAIIFLIFVTLTVTIIEVSRMKIADVQTKRAVDTSIKSVLAEYNRNLKDEFGLFGLNTANSEQIKGKISDYINHSLNTLNYLPEQNIIYKILNNSGNDHYWNFYNYKIEDIDTKKYNNLINTEVTKQQILEFMKYRAPFLATEPFLDKLKAVSEASDTAQLLKKKNEIDKKLGAYDYIYQDLIKYIEGYEANKKTVVYGFVKQLIVRDDYKDVYSTNIPDYTLVNQITKKFEYVYKLEKYIQNIQNLYYEIKNIKIIERKIQTLKHEMDALQKNIESAQGKVLEKLQKQLKLLKNKKSILINSKHIMEINIICKYGLGTENNYKDVLKLMDKKVLNFEFTYKKILLANKKSLDKIEKLKTKSTDLSKEIQKLLLELEQNKDEIDSKTLQAVNEDLNKALAKLYNQNSDNEQSNISIKRAQKIIQKNALSLNNLISKLNNIKDISKKIGECSTDDNTERFLTQYIIPLNETVQQMKESYKIDIQFDYGKKQNKVNDPRKNIAKKFNNKFTVLGINIPNKNKIKANSELYKNLPSVLHNNFKPTKSNFDKKIKYDGGGVFTETTLDWMGKIKSILKENLIGLRNDLYINEYILGTFKTLKDCNQIQQGQDVYNLRHNQKNNTFFDYEVEYILNGSTNEKQNYEATKMKILLIRSAVNFIYVYTDTEKRNLTFALASSIAGWWTAGLGVYIIQAGIIAAWSYAEAYVDLYNLINGKKIAFFKSKEDWNLDLDELINFSTDDMSNYTKEEKTENPVAFSYNDYIRLFLLTGVSEQDKLSRLQDLVQLNMKTKYDKNFKLQDYSVGLKVKSDISVNLMFLDLKRPHYKIVEQYGY